MLTSLKTISNTPEIKSFFKAKWFGFILKFVFVALLLYFLVQKGFLSLNDTAKAFSQWDIMIPALLVLVLNIFLGAYRWKILLKPQGIQLSFLRTLELSLLGNFFNVALPGAVSGDFVKAFYIGRELPGLRARSFGSILFDRVVGVSALVIVSAGAFLFGHSAGHFEGQAATQVIRGFLTVAGLGVIVFYAYLFLIKESHDPLLTLFKKLESRYPKAGSLVRIYEGVREYHHFKGIVIQALVLSILIHLCVGWSCFEFSKALGETNLDLISVYSVVPLGLLVTAIPVMPAGVGTGHAAFLYLFSLMGSSKGADVFTLLALFNIGVGAVGGIVYLRYKSSYGATPSNAENASS